MQGVSSNKYFDQPMDIHIEIEATPHYLVQVLRSCQVKWGLYCADGQTDMLKLTRGFKIHVKSA